jgi:hypothetical protein
MCDEYSLSCVVSFSPCDDFSAQSPIFLNKESGEKSKIMAKMPEENSTNGERSFHFSMLQ